MQFHPNSQGTSARQMLLHDKLGRTSSGRTDGAQGLIVPINKSEAGVSLNTQT